MSDFMMSQVQGLLNKVADDLDRMGKNSNSQFDSLLGAIDDLSANIFATQAVLAVLLKKHPVDAAEVKKWIAGQIKDGSPTPKTDAIVDILTKKS